MPAAYAAALSAILILLATVLGCSEDPQVETYEVARTEAPRSPVDIEAQRRRIGHMLAAILPQPDAQRAWFFKLVVPGDEVADMRPAFDEVVASATWTDGKLAWSTPAGWTERPGDANRYATLVAPGETARELTISQLPYNGDKADFVAANVNRWLRQLRELPRRAEQIAEQGRTVSSAAGEAIAFELIGVMAQRPGGAMPAGHPPVADAPPGRTAPPNPRVAPGATAAPPAATAFQADPPAVWEPGRMTAMRKAAFNVAAADGAAEVTVMDFPGQPGTGMGDVAMNLRRWAGEVGLTGLDASQLTQLTQQRQVGGLAGTYVELIAEEGDQPQATLVAMVPRDGRIWFFKIRGDRATVESQREGFAEYLDSVSFD